MSTDLIKRRICLAKKTKKQEKNIYINYKLSSSSPLNMENKL